MKTNKRNLILSSDSYKYSHFSQYPENTVNMYCYGSARKSNTYNEVVFVGLQGIIKELLQNKITQEDISEAESLCRIHGVPFNSQGFQKIVKEYNGILPVKIDSLPEGSVVPLGTVLFTVELTVNDNDLFWLPSFLETALLRVWYPTTVATRSYNIKKILMESYIRTHKVQKDSEQELREVSNSVEYAFHNFGSRGCTTSEASDVGGFGHLTCFRGTDNFSSLKYVVDYYNQSGDIGYSIPASEHSTVTSWERENEMKMVLNHLETYKDYPVVACVADSYDVYEFTRAVTSGTFKEKIESDNYPIFTIRPDSGDPVTVIQELLNIMQDNNVSYTTNEKGYKLFNKYRILWGDGVNQTTIRDILSILALFKYSSENIVFGSGGWLNQDLNRDTLGFAVKCSNITVQTDSNLREIEVYKEPITDQGKKSLKGKVKTYLKNNEYIVDTSKKSEYTEVMRTIYNNGVFENETTLNSIRDLINNNLINYFLVSHINIEGVNI